jgi:hypothetical protein
MALGQVLPLVLVDLKAFKYLRQERRKPIQSPLVSHQYWWK